MRTCSSPCWRTPSLAPSKTRCGESRKTWPEWLKPSFHDFPWSDQQNQFGFQPLDIFGSVVCITSPTFPISQLGSYLDWPPGWLLSPLSWCPAPQEELPKFQPTVIAPRASFPSWEELAVCLVMGLRKASVLRDHSGLLHEVALSYLLDLWCHLKASANPALPHNTLGWRLLWHMIDSWSWLW